MSFQYCSTFVDTTVTTSSSATGYPVANAADRSLPFAAWRSVGVANHNVIFDAGVDQPLAFIALMGCNIPLIRLQVSNNGTDYIGITGYGAFNDFPVSRDGDSGLYNLKVVPTAPMSVRYVRVNIVGSQTPLYGVNYYTINTFFWGTALNTWTRAPQPEMPLSYNGNYERQELKNGRIERASLGNPYQRFSFTQTLTPAVKAEWDTVKLLGETTPVLWFFNMASNSQDMYWAEQEDEVTVRKSGFYDEVTMNWRTKT